MPEHSPSMPLALGLQLLEKTIPMAELQNKISGAKVQLSASAQYCP